MFKRIALAVALTMGVTVAHGASLADNPKAVDACTTVYEHSLTQAMAAKMGVSKDQMIDSTMSVLRDDPKTLQKTLKRLEKAYSLPRNDNDFDSAFAAGGFALGEFKKCLELDKLTETLLTSR